MNKTARAKKQNGEVKISPVAKIVELLWQFAGALIMEPKKDQTPNGNDGRAISLGRVCFLTVFCTMIYIWLQNVWGVKMAMAPGLMEAFYALGGYVLGGKFVGALKTKFKGGR